MGAGSSGLEALSKLSVNLSATEVIILSLAAATRRHMQNWLLQVFSSIGNPFQ